MTDESAPGTALEARPVAALPAEVLTDDEIRRYYRIAEALYLSGAWKKQLGNAEAAFAKMIIGRDLGLSPAQSMQGIYIVDGGIQMNYAMLGHFVRAREGYDFRAGWIKEQPLVVDLEGREPTPEEAAKVVEGATERVFVWDDEEDPLDDRPVVGSVVVFTVDGEQRGVSRYTEEDAQKANLLKPDAKAAWNTSRRNMLRARSMSNGVKWFVPEVMGGLPVYVEGELQTRERPSLTAPAGEGGDAGTGIDLGPKVEEIIERATALGHRGLSNRGAIELALGNRAPGPINKWLKDAKAELDRFETEKKAAAEAAADPATGEVQGDTPDVPEVDVDAPPEEVHGEPVPETEPPPEEPTPPDATEVPAGEAQATTPDPAKVASDVEASAAVQLLRNRLDRLNGIDPETLSGTDKDQLFAEIDHVEGQLRALGVEVES